MTPTLRSAHWPSRGSAALQGAARAGSPHASGAICFLTLGGARLRGRRRRGELRRPGARRVRSVRPARRHAHLLVRAASPPGAPADRARRDADHRRDHILPAVRRALRASLSRRRRLRVVLLQPAAGARPAPPRSRSLGSGARAGLTRRPMPPRSGSSVPARSSRRRGAMRALRDRLSRAAEQREEPTRASRRVLRPRSAGFGFLDHDLRHVRVNQALAEIMGHEREEIEGRTLRELAPMNGQRARAARPLGARVGRSRARDRDRELATATGTSSATTRCPRRPGSLGVATTVTDVTHLKDVERRLEETNKRLTVLATTDDLTQLPNRRLLDEQLELALARARRSELAVAVAQHRPRSLQGRQRLARACLRRQVARRGRPTACAPVPARPTSSRGSAATSS